MARTDYRSALVAYNNWISENLERPVRNKISTRPSEIEKIYIDLKEMMVQSIDDGFSIDSWGDKERSYLKTAILCQLEERQSLADARSSKTDNPEIKNQIRQELRLEEVGLLTQEDWFRDTEGFSTPTLADFGIRQEEQVHAVADASVEESPEFDYPQHITIKWLRDHVPIKMWAAFIGTLFTVFLAGIAFSNSSIYEFIFQDESAVVEELIQGKGTDEQADSEQ